MSANENQKSPAVLSEEDTRREALKKMGKYAAYTAPIMLGMMEAAKAQAASGSIIIGCGNIDIKCIPS